MADKNDDAPAETTAPDPVDTHPVASKLKRAIAAHPILRDEKKLELTVEDGRAKLAGTVFTLAMHDQLIDLVRRALDDDDTIFFETEPQIQPPQARTLEGKVPRVSPGDGMTKRDFSVAHLRKKR